MSEGNRRGFIDYQQEKERSNKAMKCPLLMIGWSAAEGGEQVWSVDCFEKGCAWWDDKNECCLVSTLISSLNFMGCLLYDIKEGMPKQFQFREK